MPKQVFISYAHADDLPFDEGVPGWVTFFVDKLQRAVARQAGGAQVEFWMDHRLEPQRRVDDELRRRVRESAVIVAMISPRYMESEWCQREMQVFVDEVGGGLSADRVFLVEVLPTSRDDWHRAIQDLTAVPFWAKSLAKPEPRTYGWPLPNVRGDREYWDEVNTLASRLGRELRGLDTAVIPRPPASPPPIPAPMPPAPLAGGPLNIVINADDRDSDLAAEAQATLADLDAYATVAAKPSADQPPASYRQHFEAMLHGSHGVIVVYGAAPTTWVQSKYGEVNKVLAQHRKGTWAGLLDGPPPVKPAHGLPPRNLMLLDCKRGVSKDELSRFVEALRGNNGSPGAGNV